MSGLDASDVVGAGHTLARRHGAHAHTSCDGNEYDGRMGVRVSAVFVILIGSAIGAFFPVMSRPGSHMHKVVQIPWWFFFMCKFFGTGVILATSFIHLLAEGQEKFESPCLEDNHINDYPWAFGIPLVTIFVLFVVEFFTERYAKFGGPHHDDEEVDEIDIEKSARESAAQYGTSSNSDMIGGTAAQHYAHQGHHAEPSQLDPNTNTVTAADQTVVVPRKSAIDESYSAILTGLFVLEFGILFHSVFIGLTLAVAGDEFVTLYIVLTFHQLFEGLGLGARLAEVPWPKGKEWTPYVLAAAYAVTTPISVAIGIGVRSTYPPNSPRTLITEGVFNCISGGILLYTSLVELLAHEFMFNPAMKKAPLSRILFAFFLIAAGAGLMALLGHWA